MAESLIVHITDVSGHTVTESVTVDLWGNGQVARFVREDGSHWLFTDGPELRAALEPRREIRAA